VEFRFGEDSVGALAVWIVLVAKDELNPSKERMEAIRGVEEDLKAAVRNLGTERWPMSALKTSDRR
jgi:hypothetical protein